MWTVSWPVTIVILCFLGNGYCMFGFLIFIIIERNFLYYSLHILTEKSLKHLCSIRAWVPVSFSLSLSLHLPPTLSLSYCGLWTARSQSVKGPQQVAPRTQTLVYVAYRMEWLQAYWGQDLLRSVSTKTPVKWLESPIISLFYFTICLKLRVLVLRQRIEAYFQIVVKCNPWFPDKYSFDLEIWHRVKESVEWATKQGKNIPIDF